MLIPRTTGLFLLAALAPHALAQSSTLSVPSQYPTITAAIAAAPAAATILVDPGTYTEVLDLDGKDLDIIGIAGPALTIIDGSSGNDSCVTARNGETIAARVAGFTLTGGAGKPFPSSYGSDHYGGAVYVGGGSSLRVEDCWMLDNGLGTGTFAGGVYSGGSGTHVDVSRCLIVGNHAWASGGASLVDHSATMSFSRCTIYGNTANSWGFGHQGGVSMANGGGVTLVDCVVWGNAGYQIKAFGGIYGNGTSATCDYSCVEGGFAGVGNIAASPLFVDAGNRDFGLQMTSPCVDAGDPASAVDPDGTRADMGCFYYDQGSGVVAVASTYGQGCNGLAQSAWSQLATAIAPSPRDNAAHCYDATRGEWVLFGGSAGAVLSDTWLFDGASWQQAAAAVSPPALRDARMAFDSSRGVGVLFGGRVVGGPQQNDTWEWDGANWSLAAPSTRPPERINFGMCYDEIRQRVIVFGGLDLSGSALGDTWEYDGSDWAQVASTGPAPRELSAMAYDPVRGEAVLVGGRDATGALSDTWTWDGVSWTQRVGAQSPPGILLPALAWDPIRAKLVHFGGAGAGWASSYADVSEWDGNDWSATTLSGSGPSPRHGAMMIWDAVAGRMSLFGGRAGGISGSFYGDFWELSLSGGGPLQMLPAAPPILGATGSASIVGVPNTGFPFPVGGVTLGFSDTVLSGAPVLPLSLAPLGMSGCELLHSNDVSLPVTLSGVPGVWDFALSIPSNTGLLQAHVYLQAYAAAPEANTVQFIVSNGIDWLIGNQ